MPRSLRTLMSVFAALLVFGIAFVAVNPARAVAVNPARASDAEDPSVWRALGATVSDNWFLAVLVLLGMATAFGSRAPEAPAPD